MQKQTMKRTVRKEQNRKRFCDKCEWDGRWANWETRADFISGLLSNSGPSNSVWPGGVKPVPRQVRHSAWQCPEALVREQVPWSKRLNHMPSSSWPGRDLTTISTVEVGDLGWASRVTYHIITMWTQWRGWFQTHACINTETSTRVTWQSQTQRGSWWVAHARYSFYWESSRRTHMHAQAYTHTKTHRHGIGISPHAADGKSR